jgi:predicted nucleic acid-binding protein
VRYLLDTTFAVDFLRGEPAAVERFGQLFRDGDEPYVNEVVLCELAVGMREANDRGFLAFVRVVSFAQPGPETAIEAGSWRRTARQRGRTLSLSDALIATAANALSATLLTRNLRDFELAPVKVSLY